MPLQVGLVRYISGLRLNTASHTDARVRLTGEVLNGILAAKMLNWEEPLYARSVWPATAQRCQMGPPAYLPLFRGPCHSPPLRPSACRPAPC